MVRGASEMKGAEVPKEMMDAMKRTLSSVEELEAELPHILSHSNPVTFSDMPPLQRAHSLFTLANITSTLFSLKLRCRGVNPDDHPVKAELDRLKVYQRKLGLLGDVSEAPILPSASLNKQASVDHSSPDPISAERQDMTNINGGEGPNMNYQEQVSQKRKYPFCEEQSVQIAAEELVKKERVEFLGDNYGSVKEPIVIDLSDDDE